MKDNKRVLAIMVFLCVGILPLAVVLRFALTLDNPQTMFVDPPLIMRQDLIVGERFSVNVSVVNVTDLHRYEFTLSFNTVMLDVVGVTLLPDANLPVGNWMVNDPQGIVKMNVTYEGASITTNDTVALASIKFKIMNSGQSPLHLYDTGLFDSNENAIPHETQDGMVIVLRHDVAILSVEASTYETYTGRLVNVTVVAINYGDVAESFTVKVYHNDSQFGSFDVTSLAASANITIEFTWDTSDVAAGNTYTLKAEATAVPFETDLANNILPDGTVKVKIIGDVNGDNKVDLEDWVAFDAAWGTHFDENNWNPQADINGDGVVDNADGVLIAQNYRNTA